MSISSKLKSIFSLGNRKEVRESNRIEYLTNELIEELKKDGKSIASPYVSNDFGSFTVFVHNLGTENEKISLCTNNWEVTVKPTFKEF